MSDRWTTYYDAVGGEPRETLLIALDNHEREHGRPGRSWFAVDLGCGTGRDTAELLRRGWRVLAIDSEPAGIDRLERRLGADGGTEGRLETRLARFDEATWPAVDLVNASYALPFCPPESFAAVWSRIVASLAPGGRFCGQLFGDNDEWALQSRVCAREWASPPGMSFHSRQEVQALFDDLDIEHLEEIDEDGTTAVGDAKHWHLFHVVARKR